MKRKTVEERFWSKVNKTETCWLWASWIDKKSLYGRFWYQGISALAHVVAYKLTYGEYTEETLDHTCKIRHCVNPAHLEPVSNKTNVLRGNGWAAINARKTHCPKGHEYTPENTYIHGAAKARVCKKCKSIRRESGKDK